MRVTLSPSAAQQSRDLGQRGWATCLALLLASGAGCKRDNTLSDTQLRAATAGPENTSPAASQANAVAPANTSSGSLHYRVQLDPRAGLIGVELCPSKAVLTRLVAPIDEARPLLQNITVADRKLSLADKGVSLGVMPAGACVKYQVNLTKAFGDRGLDARRSDDDLLLSPDLWMWTPEPRPKEVSITVEFNLPPGWTVALPWPQIDKYHYRIPESAFVWRTQGAFGTLAKHTLKTGGAEISAYVLGSGWGARNDEVIDWVQTSADAVSTLFGRFPCERAQALLVTTPATGNPFGMAMHGGGMSTFVLIPEDIDFRDQDGRWTVVHELLHFSLPPIINRDAWLHEGITTYLTTKARARAGLISETFAWWELLDGFERGRNTGSGLTLREESAKMRENHAYWRVYWSGAAMALSMDMKLTEQGSSLEKTLLDLAASNVDHSRRWDGPQVLELLDRSCGSSIPSNASTPHLDSAQFPNTETLAKQLGIAISGKHQTRFDDSAPKANLRRTMMQPQ